ncbi:MAG: hypothetical protein QNJ14_06175 [Woeseiaceae bacterium]|nr:hypothetical protein [Woeseiaceae bacterium]
MTVKRTFYVTQGSLSVWTRGASGLTETAVFADDDSGLRQFDAYLADVPETPSSMLIDVIEEEFSLDSIPKLGWRDRGALLQRRCQQKFRRTPYRLSQVHGRNARHRDELDVLHSAISNHELLDPWLQIVLRHRTPLAGVYSVPLLAPDTFRRIGAAGRGVLCVASHQRDKLRQVFLSDGHLRSARLTQAPTPSDESYPQFIVTEAMRSRRYLERLRLLDAMQILEVRVVANGATAAKVAELAAGNDALEFSFIGPDEAGDTLLGNTLTSVGRFEEVYIAAVMRRCAKLSYAQSGEDRYWTMRRMRQALIGGTAALAAACSAAAAVLSSDAWFLRGRVVEIQSQLTQLSATFRRENERFDPIQADSHEMKLAVDTGDFILENRVPVPWVMNQLGVVMGAYPDINLRELHWKVEESGSGRPSPRRGERQMPVPVQPVNTVTAVVMAEFAPFDGDMRHAFARIDALARDLEVRTDFSFAMVVEYPFNNSPSASLSGEIAKDSPVDVARFRLSLSYHVPGSTVVAGETNDDPV